MRENYLQWSKQLYPQIIYWKKELIYLNRPKINIIVWQVLNYPVGAKELVKTENCKSWIVWKCKSTFFPLWSSKGLYVVCSLMLLNNIYWWRCALFLNLPHKKNIIQLVFTHSSRSGYMITPQGYPRPNFLLSSNVTILPTHLLRFFKKNDVWGAVFEYIYRRKKIPLSLLLDRACAYRRIMEDFLYVLKKTISTKLAPQ